MWVTGTYDPATNQTIWGTGNPVPMFDPTYRPGDNLYTNSAISWDPDTGKMNWYFQFTPGDMWDYDEVGTHILIDGVVAGQPRKLITHSARNGFLYTMDRFNGRRCWRSRIWRSTGPRASTRRPASRSTMIPARTSKPMPAWRISTRASRSKKVCPSHAGGNNYWPYSYSPKTKLLYIPSLSNCVTITIDPEKHTKERGWNGGLEPDRRTLGERPERRRSRDRRDQENRASALPELRRHARNRRRPRLHRADGRHRRGLDDTTLDELWKINVGSGFSAPPMTFEVNGKQYRRDRVGAEPGCRSRLVNTPELKEQRNALVLYVFGL